MKRQPRATQRQQYDAAHRKLSDINATFVELWPSMTEDDLKVLIERRPELWGRFSGYVKGDR